MSGYTEDFAQPDSATINSNWVVGGGGFSTVSGAAVPTSSATCFARRVSLPGTGNQECAMVQGNVYGGSFIGTGVRFPAFAANAGLTTIGPGYVQLLSGSTGTALSIRRKENLSSTLTTLASGTATADVRLDNTERKLQVWDSAPGVVELRLLVKYPGDTDWTLVCSYTDSSASAVPNTQTATIMWASGTGDTSQRFGQVSGTDISVTAPDTTPPTTPTGVTATATSSTSVSIGWTASTDASGIGSYRIRRNGSDLTGATALTGTSFTDTTVTSGTYSYTVSALDTVGNRSAESAAATVTITPADTTPPPVPTGLTATAGVQQAALSWTAVTDPGDLVGYKVYVDTVNPPMTLVINDLGTTYTRTGLTAGTTYYVAVASYDQADNISAKSTVVSVVPTAPAGSGPTGLSWWDGTTETPVASASWFDGTTETAVTSTEFST